MSYFFFQYGQLFLYSIGLTYNRHDLLSIYAQQEIINYSLYYILGTVFFLIGSLTAVKNDAYLDQKIVERKNENKDDIDMNRSLKIVYGFLFVISAPAFLLNLTNNMFDSLKYGYSILYEPNASSMFSNITESITMWFVPSVFILIVLYKEKKIVKSLFILIIMYAFIAGLLTGTRSNSIALLSSFILLWDTEIKKITKTQKILLLVLVIVIFTVLPVIAHFRNMETKNITEFINIYSTIRRNDSLLVNIIGELGGSMQPWLLVNRLIPGYYNFKLGQSYIASFIAIIPSVLMGGYSVTTYSQLSGWLKEATQMSYGPGFSILAESYYNFGWYGVPFMVIKGWFYFKILSNPKFQV